jgi:uncharacterized protein YceK
MTKLCTLCILITSVYLTGCSTVVAVADVTTATVIYAGKTVVNTIDLITPDIVNYD